MPLGDSMKFSFLRESFRMFWSGISFLPGLWALSRLHQPIVTIFGGTDLAKDQGYGKMSYELGKKLVQSNFSVITGGGTGIMSSAHCGASSVHKEKREQQKWTLGIGVEHVNGKGDSPCSKVIFTRYFFIRKWLLIRYSAAYVIFPGGIGTVDELFETFNLLRHNKITSRPVILIGKEYWHSLIDWYNNSAKKTGLITPEREAPFSITDDIDEAVAYISLSNERTL